MKTFNKNIVASVVIGAFIALGAAFPGIASAATTPALGTTAIFGVLSSTFTRNIGLTDITGSAAYTTLSGGGTDSVSGTTYMPAPSQTGTDQGVALADINAQVLASCTTISGPLEGVIVGANPPGTFPAGCYTSVGAMDLSVNGVITLDGGGDPAAVFIFKPGGALTTGDDSIVVLASSTSACNVFWAPTGATTLGANASATTTPTFSGTIFRGDGAGLSITLGHFANYLGRLLAYGSTVTTDTATIAVPSCGASTHGTLHVIKTVVNNYAGAATSSDFTVHVKNLGSGLDVSGSPQLGTTTPGTLYLLPTDSYVVSEVANPLYTAAYSGDCDSTGNVVLASGADLTCTITNTDIAPPAPVVSSGGSSSSGSRIRPIIAITKIPTPLMLNSGPGLVTYDYVVSNPGRFWTLMDVVVTDDKCSPLKYISGDLNSDKKINLDEKWSYSCVMKLYSTTTNTVTVIAYSDEVNRQLAMASVMVTVPVSSTYHLLSAVSTSTPGFPNTGFPPENNMLWYILVSISLVALVSVSPLVIIKKNEHKNTVRK